MSDRRLTPANSRVAHRALEGTVESVEFVDGNWQQIRVSAADILAAPDGPRDRQALFGEHVLVLEVHQGYAFIQAAKDGYVGYIKADELVRAQEPSHWVTAPATHLYSENSFKSAEVMALSFGSYLTVVAEHARFYETAQGHFVPKPHVDVVGMQFEDTVSVAENFMGTPYLWGGNGRAGLDCSGLVQAAFLACGKDCPGDSDQQESMAGTAIGDNVKPQRGDLFFWKGHVAMVKDEQTLIHANAHHMAVVEEALEGAIERIEAQGDGPVTSRWRPL